MLFTQKFKHSPLKNLYEHFLNHPKICTDSRNILQGSIFFALKGPSFNGNTFAENALMNGASFAVVDEQEYVKDARFILVNDVLKALQELANYHRRQLKIPFLAITGSNGKTTTKELVKNVLAKKYITAATKGNLNNHIGVPLSILSITAETEFAVIEMGANHQGEIESYCKIAEPDYGLITNIGKAHLEGFGGFAGVLKGKGELYKWIAQNGKAVFMNGGNLHLNSIAEKLNFPEVIQYGSLEEFYCKGSLTGEQPFLTVKWKCKKQEGVVNTSIVGSYNFENILSAICIGNYFDIDPGKIKDAIEAYIPGNSRSQVVKKGSNTIILDAYNANPTSMEAALSNFDSLTAENKIVFIGEMAELGEESFSEHRRIIEILKMNNYKEINLVGKNFEKFIGTVTCNYFENSEEAAAKVKEREIKNSLILIKGSRSTKMENIFDSIN